MDINLDTCKRRQIHRHCPTKTIFTDDQSTMVIGCCHANQIFDCSAKDKTPPFGWCRHS